MALHFYDTDPQALITYVQEWFDTFGMPIMLTEFACEVRVVEVLVSKNLSYKFF